jgi:hypothetical protein
MDKQEEKDLDLGKTTIHCEKVNESTQTGVKTEMVEMDELWTFV